MIKEKTICLEMKKVNNMIKRTIGNSLSEAGFDEVTIMHGWVLGYIYNSSAPVYQKDIEKHFCMARSTATNILQLMEKKGYIRRDHDEKDGRLKSITLTETGKEVHMKTVSCIDEVHERIEQGIPEDMKAAIFSAFSIIENNIYKISQKGDSEK